MVEPTDMMNAVSESMKDRTGRSLDEWVTLVESEPGLDPLQQNDVRAWLRDVHGVKQNSQWAIAFAAAERSGWQASTIDEQVNKLYFGTKAALRPLHDAVVALALSMGKDTAAQSRSTYVPVVRKTQFAAVAPGPRGTLRVGLRYKGKAPADDRLEPAKGFAQATHWLHLAADTPVDEVDELAPLVRAAYEQNG